MEIIIALVVFGFIFKYVMLNVKINSIIFGIASVLLLYIKPHWFPQIQAAAILLLLNLIDCIRDVIVDDKYYESEKIDGLYALKSLSSIALMVLAWFFYERNFILGFIPRVVFLVAVYPIQYLSVFDDIKTQIGQNLPVPFFNVYYSNSQKKNYWYKKVINSIKKHGELVSNSEIVREEFKCSKEKLADYYPQKLLKRLVVSIVDKKKKQNYEMWKNELEDRKAYRHMAYITINLYSELKQRVYKVLVEKNAVFSPCDIQQFAEFKDLNLNYKNGTFNDTEWSKYFIIKALSEYVSSGEINDYSCNDEPLDNHSYGVKIKSQVASDNPLLALDDDF